MANDSVIGAFSEEHARRLTGISLNQLRRWDKNGFFEPSYGVPDRRLAYSRIYSFRDLVSLRVLNDLRNDKKISLQHLRDVSLKLAHLGDSRWSATTLYVLGKRVVFDDPRGGGKEDIVSGQRILDIPLRVVIASVRGAVLKLNNRNVEQIGKTSRSRFVSENQVVFSGTRIAIEIVQEYLRSGYSRSAILKEYPDLTSEDIDSLEVQVERAAA